jgi:hypothetical protein
MIYSPTSVHFLTRLGKFQVIGIGVLPVGQEQLKFAPGIGEGASASQKPHHASTL